MPKSTSATRIMLDSGAWSAFQAAKRAKEKAGGPEVDPKTVINIDAYIDFIKNHAHLLTAYINLDVIDNGEASYENWCYMRSKGLNPIPVWHAYTDISYLKRYLRSTDYIGIGDVASMPTQRRKSFFDRIWNEHLTDSEGYPVAKFHGLGVTTPELIVRYPWYSVDSTSWVLYGRYGFVLIPRVIGGVHRWDLSPQAIFISSQSPSKHIIDGRHFDAFKPREQQAFALYIAQRGFTIEELKEDWRTRDMLNMVYFLELEKSLPEYPWPFKEQLHDTLFSW